MSCRANYFSNSWTSQADSKRCLDPEKIEKYSLNRHILLVHCHDHATVYRPEIDVYSTRIFTAQHTMARLVHHWMYDA